MEDNLLLQEISNQLQKTNDLLAKSFERLKQKDEIIEQRNQELKTWNIIKQPESQVDIKSAADVLKLSYVKGSTLGQKLLFEFLRYCEILCVSSYHWNEPRHDYIPKYFNTTEVRIQALDKTVIKTIVTQEGLDFIRKLYEERGDEWILSR